MDLQCEAEVVLKRDMSGFEGIDVLIQRRIPVQL